MHSTRPHCHSDTWREHGQAVLAGEGEKGGHRSGVAGNDLGGAHFHGELLEVVAGGDEEQHSSATFADAVPGMHGS